MAKVGTEVIRARKGATYVQVNINFYRKGTYFAPSNLPEGFKEWHKGEVQGKTYSEVVEKITALLRDYWDASVTQRKMIMYNVEAEKSLDACEADKSNHKAFWQLGRKSSGPSISLSFRIIWEVTMGCKKFYCDQEYQPNLDRDITGRNVLHSADGFDYRAKKFAPHTDELEAFFRSTQDTLNKLVDRINDFFEVDPLLLSSKIKDIQLLK